MKNTDLILQYQKMSFSFKKKNVKMKYMFP